MIHFASNVFGIIGAVYTVYMSVRVAVTVWDISTRWRRSRAGDPNAWKTSAVKDDPNSREHWLEGRDISQLSVWPEFEKFSQMCRDEGKYPVEDVLVFDPKKVPAEDALILSRFGDPLESIQRQLEILFTRYEVADKMEVRRDKNKLYICSPSW